MKIQGKEIVADEGKYLHRIGSDIYFTRCTLLQGEGVENFEEVFEKPNEEDVELEQLKQQKIEELNVYYDSNAVNIFYVGDIPMWLDPTLRANIQRQIEANILLENPTTNLPINGAVVKFPNDTAKLMLAKIELYAGECYNVRDKKIYEINALTTKEEIESYDITAGFPEVLKFEMAQ